jgi:hypothetical protein
MGDDHYRAINPERIPFGPVDDEVGVLRIEDMSGRPRAIVMNYACHADVVCLNYEISADFPGAAAKKVEEAFPGAYCRFVNGAAGNVAPLFTVPRRDGPNDPFKTDYAPMERMGELLAIETIKVANSLSGRQGETTIKHRDESVQFKGRFDKNRHFDVLLTTMTINDDIVIAANAGELFAELGIAWKKQVQAEVANPFYFGYTWSGGHSPWRAPESSQRTYRGVEPVCTGRGEELRHLIRIECPDRGLSGAAQRRSLWYAGLRPRRRGYGPRFFGGNRCNRSGGWVTSLPGVAVAAREGAHLGKIG